LYRVLAMGGYQDHRHWRRGYSTAPHPRSKAGWLRWLRLNPPKVAPFFAAPNTKEELLTDDSLHGRRNEAETLSLERKAFFRLRRCYAR